MLAMHVALLIHGAMVSLHVYHSCFTAHCHTAFQHNIGSTLDQQPTAAIWPYRPNHCLRIGPERKVISVEKRVGKIPRSPDSDLEAILVAEAGLLTPPYSPVYHHQFDRSRSPSVRYREGQSPDSWDLEIMSEMQDQNATGAAASSDLQLASPMGSPQTSRVSWPQKAWGSLMTCLHCNNSKLPSNSFEPSLCNIAAQLCRPPSSSGMSRGPR